MTNQFLKFVLGGILLGTALFFIPFFVLKVFVFFLIIGLLFRIFSRPRYHGWRRWAWANPDNIRNMSDEEYEKFKARFRQAHCGYWGSDDVTENKNEKNDEKE